MKNATACRQCRETKKKCHQQNEGEACDQCLRRQIECSHLERSQNTQFLRPSEVLVPLQPDSRQDAVLPDELVEELVEYYIHYIHDRPHSLFHLSTLRTELRNKQLKDGLLYALLSFGSRFHKDAEIYSLAQHFFDKSKRAFYLEIEDICLQNIQTCILLANLSAASLNSTSEALYVGIGIRMAEIMALLEPDPSDSIVMNETKRRVWWTMFMAERWCAVGHELPRKIKNLERSVDLPMDEDVFQQFDIGQASSTEPRKLGLWAHMITLVELFGPIQNLNRRLAREDVDEEETFIYVAALAQQLDLWEKNLPDDIRMSEYNLYLHCKRGLGGPFITLHMGHHHYSTLLFFQYLDVSQPATLQVKSYAERCKYHASSMSTLLKWSREIPNCEAVHPGVSHNAIVSSSVLVHTLLFGHENELPDTRASLNSNYESLMKLTQYWPTQRLTIQRLITFQNACLERSDPQKYRFDRWMVKFLLERHEPLNEKHPELEASIPFNQMDLQPSQDQRLLERGRMANDALAGFLQ